MPQTRFVLRQALAMGLKPIVVVNKVDRPGARPEWVVNQTFDLFDKLGATEEQLDFPVVYASALNGWAVREVSEIPSSAESPAPNAAANRKDNDRGRALAEVSRLRDAQSDSPAQRAPRAGLDLRPLFDAILEHVPMRADDPDGPLQLQICSLDYSSYVGRIGIGRINRGRLRAGQQVAVLNADGAGADSGSSGLQEKALLSKVNQVLVFRGLERVATDEAEAGDIVLVNGVEPIGIGVTLADPEQPEALPLLKVDEPTLTMNFQVNTSPFAGREGKFVTSRQLHERLVRETMSNVALRVEETGDPDIFLVSGRGELHLGILLENMRREGYELAVARPHVVVKHIDGAPHEPFEMLTVDVEEIHQGAIMEALGERRGDFIDMLPDSKGRVRLDYRIPARGLIGFQSDFLTLTRGTGVMSHVFDDYGPMKPDIPERRNGVLVSAEYGEAVAYALWKLQERGRMFVNPGDPVYEGMVIGLHSRDNDLVVNPVKTKQLTNIRAAGKDEAILLTPPIRHTLESAIEFIAEDELVEITPKSIRIRKRFLREHERKRASRAAA